FHPPIYAYGDRAKLKKLATDLHRRDLITGARWTEKVEFWSGKEIEALQLNMADSSNLLMLREIAPKLDRETMFYNLDLPSPHHYLCLKHLFPLCRLSVELDRHGNLIEVAATNSPWDIDHAPLPLSVMRMRGERMRPLTSDSRIIVATDADEFVLQPNAGA